MAASVATARGETLDLACCREASHDVLSQAPKFSCATTALPFAYKLAIARLGMLGKCPEHRNVRNGDETWLTRNASECPGSQFTGIVLLRPRPQFRQAQRRRQETTAKNCRLATAGECKPPRRLNRGLFADENDWPSHRQPGWLWCRAAREA